MTCQTCGQDVPYDNAAIDPRTGQAWHVDHYGISA